MKKIEKYISLTTILLLFLPESGIYCQSAFPDIYIRIAFQNSPLLYQKSTDIDKAHLAKNIATGYRLPTASFQLGYQTAAGGRNIDLPVGDMLNGVYTTLNHLTNTNSFPTIENQSINFLPSNFYDAKVRTTIPIYNAEVGHNIRLSENQIIAAETNLCLQKRQLAATVKEAYFNYLMAIKVKSIYTEAIGLAREGRRVNSRLLEHGKGLPAYILRSDAEIASIEDEAFSAETAVKNAQYWFNFILNRPDTASIDTSIDEEALMAECRALLLSNSDNSQREELSLLHIASASYKEAIQLQKSAAMPRLNGILDLGSQSENWRFNNQSRYFLLGLQLEVPIFSANRIKQKTAMAKLDLDRNESVLDYSKQQLQLSAKIAINNLRTALETLDACKKQVEAASAYRRLIDKGYTEGVSTFIETIDARNQWKTSQLACKIQLYKVFLAGVKVERELALFNIDQ